MNKLIDYLTMLAVTVNEINDSCIRNELHLFTTLNTSKYFNTEYVYLPILSSKFNPITTF